MSPWNERSERKGPEPFALAGRYQIERELGQGGMATVYLAHDLRQDGLVALKVLRPELSGVVGAERFAREIAIAARLNHPHILPIYDSGSLELGNGAPVRFYTMPFVAGKSLRDRLAEAPQLPIEEAVRIARQAAGALEHAHQQGIVHRDIKPENILLGESGALVSDFGIARALDAADERLTQTGLALGTPAYMSPEQATGTTRLDGRADVYALGCVLYEMLAGEPPFTGPTAQAVLARHAMDRVPSLRTLRPEVSAGLSHVVRRALAKIPADRYPTARAFADALTAPETERTDEVTASGATRARELRRRILGEAALAVVSLAVVALVLLRQTRRAPPVPLDSAAVAVAPFRVSSRDPALAYLGEGIVDLLATKLGGTMAVRPVDSRTALDAWRRVRGSAGDAEAGRAMARAVGAGQVVQGELSSTGTRTTLSAALRRAADGKESARVTLAGPTDSLTSMIDNLAARLLVRTAGEPEERLAALAGRPGAPLRAYLDGWTLLRRADAEAARKKFEEAVAEDSTFALAALGATRATFETGPNLQTPDVQLAWRLRDSLTPSDRAYLEAILGPKYPSSAAPADRLAAAERLTRLSPENAEAWFLYAIYICDLYRGDPDTPARCRAAYRRSAALDSASAPILYSATDWAGRLGDTAGVRRTLRLFMRLDSVSPNSLAMQWRAWTSLGDSAAARRIALSDSLVSTRADEGLSAPAWQMTTYYLNEGRGISDIELVLQRTLSIGPTSGQRSAVETVQYLLAVIRGRATGPSQWDLWWRVLNALFADSDPVPAAAADSLQRQLGSPIKDGCCMHQFAAAEVALERGRPASARLALADIQRFTGPGKGEPNLVASIVAAQLAARERPANAGKLLAQLDSRLATADEGWQLALVYGNLIAARLHEQRGEYDAALSAIRWRDPSGLYPAEVTFHREEGRIAAEAGDTAGAIRAYERYLRIRADAEPRLQPQVQRVGAALAALRHSR